MDYSRIPLYNTVATAVLLTHLETLSEHVQTMVPGMELRLFAHVNLYLYEGLKNKLRSMIYSFSA